MKIRKKILRILILFIGIIMIYNIKGYCNVGGTKRIEIKSGTTAWSVTVKQAYEECEALNAATSTLGTTRLSAHLTTDADWSIMAMFSTSQYGGATGNTGKQIPGTSTYTTNGNKSGIFNLSDGSYITGIVKGARSNAAIDGLYKNGELRPYVKLWESKREDNRVVWFVDKSNGGTYNWFNVVGNKWDSSGIYPITARLGLFDVPMWGSSLSRGESGLFRPVIWN